MSTTSTTAVRPGIIGRNRWKLILAGLLLGLVGLAALWTTVTLTFSYSDGDRIGYVQKFSHKGWVCRTWEGELAMTPVPGSIPQIFEFTVPNEGVAQRLAVAEGKKVALHYEEKRGIPSKCFGETRFFVTDVRLLAP